MPLLEIEDLHVEFPTQAGVLHAVDGVSLTLDEGDVLGIVGESGSGKSVTHARADGPRRVPGPRARDAACASPGHDLLRLSDRERRRVIGGDVAMIFQEPTTSLNPCFTIGFQLAETLRAAPRHGPQGGAQALDRAARAGRHSGARRAASTTFRTRCRAA